PGSSRSGTSSSILSWWTGAAARTVRHGGVATGSSSRTGEGGGAGGAAGSGSLGVSRTDSASWIADRAASVGSFIFLGVLAVSVVASYYAGPLRRTTAAAGQAPNRATGALASICLRIPLGQPAVTRRADTPLPFGYPTGLGYRRKLLVKVSLIIVNVAR